MLKKLSAWVVLCLCLLSTLVYGLPLETHDTFMTNHPDEGRKGQWMQWLARGTGTNDLYVVEVDPTTGAFPHTFVFTQDTDYGTVGANTIRTGAQIGNATGAADFNSGAASAQTLRVTVATDDDVTVNSTDLDIRALNSTDDEVGVGDGTDSLDVNSDGSINVITNGSVVSSNNSTTTPLGGGATFTGTADETTSYNSVTVLTYSDVASAADGLKVQWSSDGTNWDITDSFTIEAATGEDYHFGVMARYMRVTYTNGGSAQGSFRLQTLLHKGAINHTNHRLSDAIDGDHNAEIVKSVLTGLAPSGSFVNVDATNGGSLKVSIEESNAEDFGATATAQRVAAIIGNTTGAIDYNAGNASAQTPRVVIATDQAAIPASQSGTWNITNVSGTVSLPTGAATEATLSSIDTSTTSIDSSTTSIDGKLAADYGVSSGAVRTAAQVGNASGVADFGAGTAGAQTLRVVQASDNPSPKGRSYADSVRNDYSSVNVTTSAWVQLIASTSADINSLMIFDSCGEVLELGTGAAASETRVLLIPPGGIDGQIPLFIASGTRVAIKAVSANCTSGQIVITGLN